MTDSSSLRIVFAGTPEFAAKHLQALLTSPHQLVGVYTQPDRPAGRGKKLTPSPVKQLAEAAQLPVFQPASLKTPEAQQELEALQADIMVVVAYGLLLPQAVLDLPRLGCINVHGSLLPRWRGAAPIQRAIEAGDTQTGVTIMQMEAGLDTGPMLHTVRCAITAEDTAGSLHDRLAELGPEALLHALVELAQGGLAAERQNDSLSNYARKIDKEEAALDWEQEAVVLDRKIRAFNPFPMAYCFARDDRLRIYTARALDQSQTSTRPAAPGTIVSIRSSGICVQCGQGMLQITRLQLPGKKPVSAAEFINGFGNYLTPGQQLTSAPTSAQSDAH